MPKSEDTRHVRVHLAAKTRHEWSAVVEVPIDASDDELAVLTNQFFHTINMEDYTQDDEYWERGDCQAENDVEPDEAATYVAVRDAQGQVTIERWGNTLWCVVHGEAFTPKIFQSRLAAEAFRLQCGDDYVSGPWEIQVS